MNFIPDHAQTLAKRATQALRDRGVTNLRFDTWLRHDSPAALAATKAATPPQAAPQAAPEPSGPTPAQALRARLDAVLRSPSARGKVGAALALALRTDMQPDHIAKTLRGLPEGVDLGLPPKSIADPAAKAEADRVRQIVTADAAIGRHEQAIALALDTDTPIAAALAILRAMPEAKKIASIEERAALENEFGGDPTDMNERHGDPAATGWAKAVARANERFEPAETQTPSTPVEDPEIR